MMTSTNSFRSSFFDVLKTDTYMLSKNNYAGVDTSVVDATTNLSSSALTVSAGTGIMEGTYNVDFSGGHLAKAAGVTSNAKLLSGSATSSSTLAELGITSDSLTIGYNTGTADATPVEVKVTSDMTLSDLAQAINTATSSNVVARFSELTGKFSIQTSNTGANTTISIKDNSSAPNLLEKLNLGDLGATSVNQATNGYGILPSDFTAKITQPDGSSATIKKSSNTFTIDGVNYNFKSATNTNFTLTNNVQKSFDKIKNVIDKYNEMIDKISTKIGETKIKDYTPLTDDQKSAMTADQITAWETKAKQGILRNDSTLSTMLTSMRSAFFQSVSGAGVTLSEIGLSTSSDYTKGGKIIIDETKLKTALQTKGDQVANIFSKTSSSQPSYSPDLTSSQRMTRTSEEGIFQRINDILLDSTRTTRDNSGNKGMLVQKAGIKGDYSEYSNLLTDDLKKKQTEITNMISKMATKQEAYYLQFSKLETTMNKLNSQSSWLSQQLGTSSNG
jgi:flagellar hook-associated protein 2